MPLILTLDIKLSGWRIAQDSWSARIEVAENTTLTELHELILQLVGFANDHLHAFFAGRTWRSRTVTFGEPTDTPYGFNEGEEVPLSEVFPLSKGHKLFYHFDFGDDWLFEIVRRPNAKQADRKSQYPQLLQEKGQRLIQYPCDEG